MLGIPTPPELGAGNATSPLVRGGPLAIGPSVPRAILDMPLAGDLSLRRGVGVATFTRSTIKTFDDRIDGLVKTAAIDVAAFETNGVLIEGASTNLLFPSEEFDNAAWNKSGTTVVTANATTAPDGATTAEKIETTTAFHNVNQAATVVSGSDHTLSVYAKKNTVATVSMAFISGANDVRRVFNLDTNAITVGAGENGLGFVSASIENLTNGWNRIKLTVTSAATSVTSIIYPDDLASGTLNSSFFWGAQLEELPFASSYIKTVASTVTRTADNLSIDAANIPAPTADYSVFANVCLLGKTGLNQTLYRTIGESNRILRAATGGGTTSAFHTASVLGGSLTPGTVETVGVTVDSTNLTLHVGSSTAQVAKGVVTGTITGIGIGQSGGGVNQLFGHIKNFRTDIVALTDAQVGALP